MKILYFFGALLLASTNTRAELVEQIAIDKIFEQWNNTHSPGGSVGVIKDNKLIFAQGYGLANLEYDIPNSKKSIFLIASTSKQFTAASIILLAEQGKLTLEDRLTKYFPEFPTYGNDITIAHLLNHTSGIRDYLTLSYLAGFNESDVYTDSQVMHWLANQKATEIIPGEQFLYSNYGYWLLGKIVEKASGKSLAEYANQEIFKPLNMQQTHFHNNHKHIVKNRASGYRMIGENQYEISMTSLDMVGDGGLYTNIEDLKKWDDAFYNRKLFSENFWRMMLKKGKFNNGTLSSYASGLRLGEHRKLNTIRHGGSFAGYRAEFIRFPEKKLSIIVLANRADADSTGKAYEIANLFIKDKKTKTESSQTNKPDKTQQEIVEFNMPTSQFDQFSGNFWDEKHSQLQSVFIKNNALMVRVQGNEYLLKAIASDTFSVANIPVNITLKFSTNKNGKRTITTKIADSAPSSAVEYDVKKYSKEKLNAFSGKYYSNELDAIYQLIIKDDKLVLTINNKIFSPLEIVQTNIAISGRRDTLTFTKSKWDTVSGFNLAARGIKNIWFKKIDTQL